MPNKYAHLDHTPMHDIEVDFSQNDGFNTLTIERHQHIPDNFISDLKSQKMDSLNARSGEMMLALSVPVSAIEEMQIKYGFDAMNAPIAEVKRMLERLHLDAFIATNKRI
jgi:hypothetical protein